MRRIAVKHLWMDGKEYGQTVIELEDDRVGNCYPLTAELPNTEWLPMTAELHEDGTLTFITNKSKH